MASLPSRLPTSICFSNPNNGTKCTRIVKDLGRSLSFDECGMKLTRSHEISSVDYKVSAASQSYQTGPDFNITSTEELENESSYFFRTEIGGQVKVIVGRRNTKYVVHVEVSSLPQWVSEDKLVMNWVMCKDGSSPGSRSGTTQTPFVQESVAVSVLELEFELNQTPFYFSFLLGSLGDDASNNSAIKSHRKTDFCVPVGIGRGYPAPLGISFSGNGSVNFAVVSRNMENMVLCLYNDMTDKPSLEIDLDPYVNRTGDVWHVSMESVHAYKNYGYRCKGEGEASQLSNVLLDPYSKILKSSFSDQLGSVSLVKSLGCLCTVPAFDWSGDVHICLPMEKLVVYRLNVAHFTDDESSKLPSGVAGTFSGLAEKLHHFKALGVNAIMLEPIFPFNEQKGPYCPYNFFSPTDLYAGVSDGVSAINSMKEMVKNLHKNNIEVLLEVVFTLTTENGDSTSELHKSSYYVVDESTESRQRSALNCNDPVIQRMILDSLRHWVTEFHIDGFSFINASTLLRGSNGEYLSRPPLIEAIAFDPVLSKTKIIADYWDPNGKSLNEVRFPHWKRWAEMNTRYSQDVKNFLRGEGLLSNLATRLCGSGDLFLEGRGPAFSLNFITRNFGLPLVDLVSFSSDELTSELSWNCGVEGPTSKPVVLERRLKQIRNFLFILYISLGIPVLNMGDEFGQSSNGSLSSERKSFDWNALETAYGVQMTEYIGFMSSLRKRRHDLLQKRSFVLEENIDWIGSNQAEPKWEDPSSKFLAMILKTDEDINNSTSDSSEKMGDLFIAFNSSEQSETCNLPPPPEGMSWFRLVDTSLPFPGFFLTEGAYVTEEIEGIVTYEMKSHSCALFEAKSRNLDQVIIKSSV